MAPPSQRILSRTLSVVLLFVVTIASAFSQILEWGESVEIPSNLSFKTITAISAGGFHSLALSRDGKIFAWGDDSFGQIDIPDSLSGKTVTAISGGYLHNLALISDGTVVAWGNNNYGQSDIPESLAGKTVTAIAAGRYHSLALTSEGTVVAWGRNSDNQCTIPESLVGKRVVTMAAGGFHSLALTSDGTVVGWGRNLEDQCTVPTHLSSFIVTQIAAGGIHSLALTSTGRVVAWGNNFRGQCDVPLKIAGKTVSAIAAGGAHSLALTSDGKIVAWGENVLGQCDVPPSLASETATAVSAGSGQSLCIFTLSKPALSVSQSIFTGGQASTVSGTITFATAPRVDLTVNLSSSDPAVTLPTTIVVPAGATTATFNLSSVRVDTIRTVKLTVKTERYPDATKTVTVNPQFVTVTASPSSFQGGTTGSGKVSLWAASATDTLVALASSDSRVNFLGATVTIPAKQKSASFNIPSAAVSTSTDINIFALPGISKQAGVGSITLIPAPKIESFTASRSTVFGNQKTTLKIKLAAPAGPGGTTVTLDADGAGLGIPKSVFFPAGIASKSFDVFADENAVSGPVRVTATSGLSSAVGIVISVNQLKVTGSTLSAGTVTGGDPVLVTVNLNATVDKDTEIAAASSDPVVVSVPGIVVVPRGAKSVTYIASTSVTKSRKTVKITASKGGYTSTKTLTVTP